MLSTHYCYQLHIGENLTVKRHMLTVNLNTLLWIGTCCVHFLVDGPALTSICMYVLSELPVLPSSFHCSIALCLLSKCQTNNNNTCDDQQCYLLRVLIIDVLTIGIYNTKLMARVRFYLKCMHKVQASRTSKNMNEIQQNLLHFNCIE